MPKPKHKELTLKEARFVAGYLGSCNGNGFEAVAAAGYKGTYGSLRVMAGKLLAKGNIRSAIKARTERERKASVISAERRDEILSAIAESNDKNLSKISAIKELNKCSGRHSMKHLHEGRLTLEQALAQSRRG